MAVISHKFFVPKSLVAAVTPSISHQANEMSSLTAWERDRTLRWETDSLMGWHRAVGSDRIGLTSDLGREIQISQS